MANEINECEFNPEPKTYFVQKFVVMVCKGAMEGDQILLHGKFGMNTGKHHDTREQAEIEVQDCNPDENNIYRIDKFFVPKERSGKVV